MNAAHRNATSEDNLEGDDSTQSAADNLDSTDQINADLEAELEAEHDPDMNEVTRDLLVHTDGIVEVDDQNDGVSNDEVNPHEHGEGRDVYRSELEGLTDSETFDDVNDQPAERFSDDRA
jgi:hypothetical protein